MQSSWNSSIPQDALGLTPFQTTVWECRAADFHKSTLNPNACKYFHEGHTFFLRADNTTVYKGQHFKYKYYLSNFKTEFARGVNNFMLDRIYINLFITLLVIVKGAASILMTATTTGRNLQRLVWSWFWRVPPRRSSYARTAESSYMYSQQPIIMQPDTALHSGRVQTRSGWQDTIDNWRIKLQTLPFTAPDAFFGKKEKRAGGGEEERLSKNTHMLLQFTHTPLVHYRLNKLYVMFALHLSNLKWR